MVSSSPAYLVRDSYFPNLGKCARNRPLDLRMIDRELSRGFTERPPRKSGFENAHPLRGESLEQKHEGWSPEACPISRKGAPCALNDHKLNIALHLGVGQADVMRAFEDYRRSLANFSCVVETPSKLASCGHLAATFHAVQARPRDWHCAKDDREELIISAPLTGAAAA